MTRTRLGIFGGTFDPPHLGHLILASEALDQLKLTRLLWMLTPQSPLKDSRSISALDQRLEMVKLAIADNPAFELSLVELDRPGPHYTLDTLHILQDQNPAADLILLIGGDSLHDLPRWHRPADLVAACREIGVMRRPGDQIDISDLEPVAPGLSDKLRFVDAPLLEIASSDIRCRVSEGRSVRYYLPPAVHAYIQRKNLYR